MQGQKYKANTANKIIVNMDKELHTMSSQILYTKQNWGMKNCKIYFKIQFCLLFWIIALNFTNPSNLFTLFACCQLMVCIVSSMKQLWNNITLYKWLCINIYTAWIHCLYLCEKFLLWHAITSILMILPQRYDILPQFIYLVSQPFLAWISAMVHTIFWMISMPILFDAGLFKIFWGAFPNSSLNILHYPMIVLNFCYCVIKITLISWLLCS